MTVDLRTPLNGFRFAETRFGDTLQAVAMRELGDGKRWFELAAINGLAPPYITDDSAQAGGGVLLSGALILVPSATSAAITTDPDLVFDRDVQLVDGQLQITDGDFSVVSGVANLRQALLHRMDTDRGDLVMHPEYGSRIRQLIGAANGPTAGQLAAAYARAVVASDPRVQRVSSATAEVSGDSIRVTVIAEPITGRAIDVSVIF